MDLLTGTAASGQVSNGDGQHVFESDVLFNFLSKSLGLFRNPCELFLHGIFQQYSTVTFVCRWSPDLPEQYQPGRRHLQ